MAQGLPLDCEVEEDLWVRIEAVDCRQILTVAVAAMCVLRWWTFDSSCLWSLVNSWILGILASYFE